MQLSDHLWQTKVWGATTRLFSTADESVHLLTLKKDSWCSVHYHRHRQNKFIVRSGAVRVLWAIQDKQFFCDLTTRRPAITIPSLVIHQFQVLADGEMVEVYSPDRGGAVDNDDIERLSTGSCCKDKKIDLPAACARSILYDDPLMTRAATEVAPPWFTT